MHLSAIEHAYAQRLIDDCSKLVVKLTGKPNTNGAAVAGRLVADGCSDKTVLVSAALGNLPYTVHTLHAEVTPSLARGRPTPGMICTWHGYCTLSPRTVLVQLVTTPTATTNRVC